MENKIGIIGGSLLFFEELIKEPKEREVETKYGTVSILEEEGICFIQRHGKENKTPPHMINHRANITAFKELGIKMIIGICSAGSLKKKIKPGSIVIPEDYINFQDPTTFFDNEIKHIIPGMNQDLISKIIDSAKKSKIKVKDRIIYVQTTGPRLETKAETRLLKNFADVAGMTLASEATLAKESNLKYAAICSINNYANGVVKKPVTYDKIVENQKRNVKNIHRILNSLVKNI